MNYILNIETATKNCSVSLSKNGLVIDTIEYAGEGYSHAEKLHIFIRDILLKNNLLVKDLSTIAVSKGPGSYTGLRIGVSAAKGLAYALNIPLISIGTLNSLAQAIQTKEDSYIIPLIDARRMEVYSAIFDNKHKLIRKVQANILNDNPFKKYLDEKKVFFIGDAIEKTKKIIQHPNAFFSNIKFPSASNMTKLSYHKFKEKNYENIAYFEPFYLKDFIITRKK